MNLKLVVIILSLSLLFFFGFKKFSLNKIESKNTDIEQLKILKYIPENNKLLFISNFDSSKIVNNIKKDPNKINKDKFFLIETSILNYLGIDLGKNKLQDIYNNELIISTFENTKKPKDDIFIVFKIKPEKNLDDILNLPNKIDQTNQIVPIKRENKLNYLNYIYRTKDNYVIASSDKELILSCIGSNNDLYDRKLKFYRELLENFQDQQNVLFTKKFEKSLFYNNNFFDENKDNIVATIFSLEEKILILKSYLVNNKKKINIYSYDVLKDKKGDKINNNQVLIFSNIKNFIKYINPLINDFEKNLLEELNQKDYEDILLINSNKDWIIIFDKNTQNKLPLSNLKKMIGYNKYNLQQNDNVYSIYSKDILSEEKDVIKQFKYEDIFSVDSKDLFMVSNKIIDNINVDQISDRFFEIKSNIEKPDFIHAEVNIKGVNANEIEYLSYLKDLNFFIKKVLKIPNIEFLEIMKQSIPEKDPLVYTETNFKIFE